MNLSRSLFALPVVFIAAITAQACSSSSPSGSSSTSTSSTPTGSCATLEACCPELPATSVSACQTIATANVTANCATNLMNAQAAGLCKAGSGTGSSSTTSTVSTSGTTSGVTTSGTISGSKSGSTTAAGGSCTTPPTTLPAGFVPPTSVFSQANPGMGCTPAEATAYGTCQATPPTTDAGENSCFNNLVVADGNFNNCGNCIFGTQVAPGEPIPATFGYFIIGGVYATLGDDTSIYGVNFGVNFGGCVIGADPVGGLKCGQDIMAQEACEFAVCLPLCAVTQAASMTQAGFNDFSTCVAAADKGACATYVTAQDTDCKALVNDAGTGPYDKCANLYNLDEGFVDGGKPTTTTEANLIGLICGGSDAGF